MWKLFGSSQIIFPVVFQLYNEDHKSEIYNVITNIQQTAYDKTITSVQFIHFKIIKVLRFKLKSCFPKQMKVYYAKKKIET